MSQCRIRSILGFLFITEIVHDLTPSNDVKGVLMWSLSCRLLFGT